MPNLIVQPLHFEDFGGQQFERLVFAFLLRTENWLSIEWYGQVGSDSGRDIWGARERDGHPQGQKVVYQCANRRTISFKKIEEDFKKILSGPNGRPDVFVVITAATATAKLRDKTKKLCDENEVYASEIWSGSEFEERLRSKAESLLKRFVEGREFPDDPGDLRDFAEAITPQSDDEILALMAGLFDRPAFYTPFHQESSIPAFKKAITDTIEALNTGVHRLRDGTEIRRIPSRRSVRSAETGRELSRIERMLGELRAKYDESVKTGDIGPCGCNVPDCPVFFVSPPVAREMDALREEILEAFRRLYPDFDVRLGWRNRL